MTLTLNMIAAAVIMAWAMWCAFSPRVNDGLLGKLLFALAALAAFGVLVGPAYGYAEPHPAEVTLKGCIAALGVRHWWLKTVWPAVVRRWRVMQCR